MLFHFVCFLALLLMFTGLDAHSHRCGWIKLCRKYVNWIISHRLMCLCLKFVVQTVCNEFSCLKMIWFCFHSSLHAKCAHAIVITVSISHKYTKNFYPSSWIKTALRTKTSTKWSLEVHFNGALHALQFTIDILLVND